MKWELKLIRKRKKATQGETSVKFIQVRKKECEKQLIN